MHTFSDGKNVYDVNALWKLSERLPATLVPIDDFLANLYTECWEDLCPIDAEQDPDHWERVEKADLAFPILIDENQEIMDGMHRLVKAARMGYKSIMAKRVPQAIAMKAIV